MKKVLIFLSVLALTVLLSHTIYAEGVLSRAARGALSAKATRDSGGSVGQTIDSGLGTYSNGYGVGSSLFKIVKKQIKDSQDPDKKRKKEIEEYMKSLR